jgi:hypothetical protein
MKFTTLATAAMLSVALAGCIVTPPRVQPLFVAPAGVAYVAPTYAVPGPGYVWAYHAHYGWGWHHPQYGWHQGWR